MALSCLWSIGSAPQRAKVWMRFMQFQKMWSSNYRTSNNFNLIKISIFLPEWSELTLTLLKWAHEMNFSLVSGSCTGPPHVFVSKNQHQREHQFPPLLSNSISSLYISISLSVCEVERDWLGVTLFLWLHFLSVTFLRFPDLHKSVAIE